MISIDYSQLEALKQVKAFLDFLKEPEKVGASLKGLKEELDRVEKLVSAVTAVEDAQKYLSDAAQKSAKADQLVKTAKETSDKILAEAQKVTVETNARFTCKELEVAVKRKEADELLARAKETKQQADLEFAGVIAERDELAQKKANLAKLERELNEKAEQLKKIIN